MAWWQYLLYPFSALFNIITKARNALFDHQIIQPVQFDTNVIGVGNLSVGGTGKTTMISYLIEVFRKIEVPVSVLSRGYKRKSYGFRQVAETDTPASAGDESYMLYKKHHEAGIFIGKDRTLSIPNLLYLKPETQVVLLDDSLQHRFVQPDVQILLTTFDRPFYKDMLMPSGRLRESRIGANRAECVIVTKCPADLSNTQQSEIRKAIQVYTKAEVFFSYLDYGEPEPIFDNDFKMNLSHIAISGIAESASFRTHVEKNFQCRIIHDYPDHYAYKSLDIKHIINELDHNTSLITTEKDKVKLEQFPELKEYSCFYIPIKMKFLSDESLFLSMLDSLLKKGAHESDPL